VRCDESVIDVWLDSSPKLCNVDFPCIRWRESLCIRGTLSWWPHTSYVILVAASVVRYLRGLTCRAWSWWPHIVYVVLMAVYVARVQVYGNRRVGNERNLGESGGSGRSPGYGLCGNDRDNAPTTAVRHERWDVVSSRGAAAAVWHTRAWPLPTSVISAHVCGAVLTCFAQL
jgi:hypothetical protein